MTAADMVDLDPDDTDDLDHEAIELAGAIRRAVVRKRADRAATEILAHADRAAHPAPPFDAGTLAEVAARPAEPAMRVDGLIPSEAGTLVVAQRKVGKSTLMLNLARSLLTGEPFLGRFTTRPVTGAVAILNYEVSARQLARWATDVAVPADRLYLVNVRGRRNPLSDPQDRAQLATLLRDHQVEAVIVDPFGRAYTGTSQNDSGEVGAWLADLDRFTRTEVGALDLVVAAHAGWNGERSRGASALEDWADSIITLTRSDTDGDESRYLRAMGRDVDLDEDQLSYDPITRVLTLAGTGNRKTVAATRKVDALVPHVVDVITEEPGIGTNALVKSLRLRNPGVTFQDRVVSKVADRAVALGLVRVEGGGPGRRKLHYPATASNRVQTASRTHHETASTPSYRGGRGLAAVPHPDQPGTLDAVDGDPA